MPKYIFLDAWVLSKYTKAQYTQKLAHFIRSNGYTIVFNGLLMTEVYNPGWKEGGHGERGANVARFLKDQHCVVIEPEEIWNEEAAIFPHQLSYPPIRLNLDGIPIEKRNDEILRVLRRSQDLLADGADIEQWSDNYKTVKSQWLNTVQKIIENGIQQGQLIKIDEGRYKAVSQGKKEEFLRSLDWRLPTHFTKSEYDAGEDTSVMRGIRFSSLCFWYQYVSPPSSSLPSIKKSDIGDIFQVSLLPYCYVFTVDTKMALTVKQALEDAPYSCQILTQHDLDMELGIQH